MGCPVYYSPLPVDAKLVKGTLLGDSEIWLPSDPGIPIGSEPLEFMCVHKKFWSLPVDLKLVP